MFGIDGIWLIALAIAVCCYLVRGTIYFCEYISKSIYNGEFVRAFKRKPARTVLSVLLCMAFMVLFWPLCVAMRGH